MANVVNLSTVQLGKRSNLDGGKRQINFAFEVEHFDTDECERTNDLDEFFEEITDDIYQQTKTDKRRDFEEYHSISLFQSNVFSF